MKTQILSSAIALLVLSACSGGMQAASSSANGSILTTTATGTAVGTGTSGVPITPTGTRGSSSIPWYFSQGGQAVLNIESSAILGQYAGHTPTSPSNAEVNLYLSSTGSGTYAGYVKIAYQDTDSGGNTIYHNEEFDSGNGSNAEYNAWVNVNGTSVFQSFFQDTYGGIIVVIDSKDDADLLSGSIWFKNFDFSVCSENGMAQPGYCAQQAPVGCWMISLGPYNCQDFLVNGKVTMGSSLYPSTYTKLGTFTGMTYSDVFAN